MPRTTRKNAILGQLMRSGSDTQQAPCQLTEQDGLGDVKADDSVECELVARSEDGVPLQEAICGTGGHATALGKEIRSPPKGGGGSNVIEARGLVVGYRR